MARCLRCLQACRDIEMHAVIGMAHRAAGASIVFDTNEPILTNVVWNTIDADIPFSGLGSVPPIAGSGGVGVPFTAVDPAGAGLGSTALLASRDGGQQRRW